MPSLSEKPSVKSSRSAGEAIITACEMPLYSSATGISSATLYPLGDPCPQYRMPGARFDADPVVLVDAAVLRIVRMDLQPVFAMPLRVLGAPCLRAHVVLRQNAPGGQDQREFLRHLLVGG